MIWDAYISPRALIYEIAMVWYIFYDLIFSHLILTVCIISLLGEQTFLFIITIFCLVFFSLRWISLIVTTCWKTLFNCFTFNANIIHYKKRHLLRYLDLRFNIVYCNKEAQKEENKQLQEKRNKLKTKTTKKDRHRYHAIERWISQRWTFFKNDGKLFVVWKSDI